MKTLKTVLKLCVFLGLGLFLVWLATKDLSEKDKAEIFESFSQVNYWWISLTFLFSLLSNLSRAIRWKMLLQSSGFEPKTSNTFFAVMIGYLANYALPRMGEVSRCGVLTRYENVPISEGLGTVVVERTIDVLCLLASLCLLLFLEFELIYNLADRTILTPFSQKLSSHIWLKIFFLTIIVAGIVVVYYLSKLKNLPGFIIKLFQFLKGFLSGLISVVKLKNFRGFILHSVFIWLMYYVMIIAAFRSIPETADLSLTAALAVLIFGSIAVILTQGGIGAYPLLVMQVLLLYGVAETAGYAFGWVAWSAQTAFIIVVGLVSLILLPILNKNNSYVKVKGS